MSFRGLMKPAMEAIKTHNAQLTKIKGRKAKHEN
jgi:hypothetical protein